VQFQRFGRLLNAQQRRAMTTVNIDDEFFDVADYLSMHDVRLEAPSPENRFESATMIRPLRNLFDCLEGLARVVVIVHILPSPSGVCDGGALSRAIEIDTERARKKGKVTCTRLREILEGRNVEIVAEETFIRYDERLARPTPWTLGIDDS
jgi:hypothetical protein